MKAEEFYDLGMAASDLAYRDLEEVLQLESDASMTISALGVIQEIIEERSDENIIAPDV